MPGKFKETAYLPTQELQEFVERSAAQQGMSKSRYLGSLVEKEAASMSGKSSQPTLVLPKPYYPEIQFQFACGRAFKFDAQITPASINKKIISHIEESIISIFREIIRNRSKDNPEYIRNTCFVVLITFIKGSYKVNEIGTASGRYDVKFTLIRVSEKEWLKYDGRYNFFKIKYYSYYDLITKAQAGTTKTLVPIFDEKYKDGGFFIPVSDVGSGFHRRSEDTRIKDVGIDDGVIAKCIILRVNDLSLSERFSMRSGINKITVSGYKLD